jgi:hypothetical protein
MIEKIMVARWEMRPKFQVLVLYTVIYSTRVRSCKLERLALVQILTYSRNYKLDSYTAYTSPRELNSISCINYTMGQFTLSAAKQEKLVQDLINLSLGGC